MTMKRAMTVAGSDSSGGAGLQADLKTFQEFGVYGMSALTTIVTMDPKNGWAHNVFPTPVEVLEAQIETILSIGIEAMKTGMLGSVEIIELVARKIDELKLDKVVIDPVMVCKGEDEVLHPETAVALRELLVPRATVVTPNLFEAAQLAGTAPIKTIDDMRAAAEKVHALGAKYVLIKGGNKLDHDKAIDLLYDGQEFEILESEKIETTNTHGAGCSSSAAIAAQLAEGKSPREAILISKDFITEAVRHSWKMNDYVGPVNHGAYHKYGVAEKTQK
ncbi:pyridoxine/pyridoxal/pyridoxamine kinase [Bacillus sp. ISL-57]|uniref:pyridoxine/pyridoxal/pyridoxamine kinase n=1 Tax=Bacillus sp. ISL-57 TaxID=2819135 RepID=UPI001BE5545F|nr:pyridoxine/pyridoxal/pyridoxamine kinase [Bacillus sp. ISL-57]MBT2717068.1 pyridoxine/pyridoxal/pyridoxamine kinase [Bacillus sp. ISL-57]